jgi:CBS domain-containing protein
MMTESVRSVHMEVSVRKVEEEMKLHQTPSMPVVDDKGAIFGMITTQNIDYFHETNKNPRAVRAWEICTYKPLDVHPDASVKEVAQLMMKTGIHHVVVTRHGLLVGIVSSFDFVKDYLKHVE